MSNSSNKKTIEETEELLFADLILPLTVWTGMGIGEVIFATLVLVAIIINKSLHKIQYFFIANLIICDLLSSFTINFMVTGTTIRFLVDRDHQGTNCRLVDTLYFPFTASFLMVTVLIFDRFITVVFPFKYRIYVTNKVAIGLVIGCWVIGFLLSSYALFSPEHDGAYTRNGLCRTTTLLSRILTILIPNVVGTFLAIIQIIYLSIKAHKLAKERQHRQSISGERNRKIALSRKAICILILLVGIVGVLGVMIPIILGFTRRFVGNESTFAKVMQNGVVPFFGKMPTIAHSLLYGFHMTEIRKTIFKIVRSLTCRK